MPPQLTIYNSIIQLFSNQIFFPEYKTFSIDDVIIINWQIQNNSYSIEIYSNGTVWMTIANSGLEQKLQIQELQVIFEMVNQAAVLFGSYPSKMFRHVKPIHN